MMNSFGLTPFQGSTLNPPKGNLKECDSVGFKSPLSGDLGGCLDKGKQSLLKRYMFVDKSIITSQKVD
jgi:hypothetical protein